MNCKCHPIYIVFYSELGCIGSQKMMKLENDGNGKMTTLNC